MGICVITHIKTTAFEYIGQSFRFIRLIIILMFLDNLFISALGVHYEMLAETEKGNEFLIQNYKHFEVGQTIGMSVIPDNIHIMKKERITNTFDAKVNGDGTIEFLGCEYQMEIPEEIKDKIQTDENGNETIRVNVPFNKIELFDNESEGTFTGNISFILYKGDHYHLTIDTDWGEKLYVDTQDVWDLGDHVAITIPQENISFE